MSAASDYGTAAGAAIIQAIEQHIGRQIADQEPEDIIAYLLTYFESVDPEHRGAQAIADVAMGHVDAERGAGDDFADDPSYYDLMDRLAARLAVTR
jgi:hypothetical protein